MPKLIAVMPVKAIDKLQPMPGKHRKVAVAPSLYIHISPTGGRSWIFRYVRNGIKIDMGIGSARELSRDEAIDKVRELQAMRKAGIDPLAARREAVIAGEAVSSIPTFKACAEAYHAANAGTWSVAHAKAWLLEMEREIFPTIGKLRVDQIDVQDVLRALKAGWTQRHETASRCRGRIEKTLDFAKTLKQRSGENPALWRGNLENLLASPKSIKRAKGEQHHAALPWGDVPAFVDQLPDTDAGKALAFLTYTAARSTEVRDAEWREIDLAARTWTIPAGRMKARKEHVVALSGPALAILEALPQQGDFVFPIGRDAMSDLMPAGSTVHGLRASFSSWAGDLGIARDGVEKCLAHLTGSATERAYRRGQEVEQKRAVMERWAAFVTDVNSATVVMLDRRRA